MCSVKRYLRRVTKRNDRVFAHTISIPAELVIELELSNTIVELKIKDGFIVIKKWYKHGIWFVPRC